MPPRALKPSGLFLLDKPAGRSSFSVVADVRRRTGARTGHAGTLDPFATGLLLVLSGAATRLAPWLTGLDKRYVTDVDLSARTSTGDPEGEVVEEQEPPAPRRAEDRPQQVLAERAIVGASDEDRGPLERVRVFDRLGRGAHASSGFGFRSLTR